MKKRLLFAIPTMRMGGAEQSLVTLLSKLDREKYDVDVFLFEDGGELMKRIPSHVNIITSDYVECAMMLEFSRYFKGLFRKGHFLAAAARFAMLVNSKFMLLTGIRPFHNWSISKRFIRNVPGEYDAAIGYLEGATDMFIVDKVNAAIKIGWIHSDISMQDRDYRREGKYYRKLDAIPVISNVCMNSFINQYPDLEGKVCLIENIADRESILRKGLEPVEDFSRPFVLTVGRLESVKGIDLALEAAAILMIRGHSFGWHVFGEGSLRGRLERRIGECGLENHFFLNGVTDNPYKYMQHCDIVVQPSRYEGKSIVLDESKIIGKPIVVTNYPSVEDQIEDKVTGLIVGIGAESIANGVERLLEDAKLRRTLSDNCKNEPDRSGQTVAAFERLLV